MKKFKGLMLIAIVILCISLMFVGCGKGEEETPTEVKASQSNKPASTPSQSQAEKTSPPPPTPTPTPKPMKEVFSDDFSGNMSKWDANYGGDWAVKDGKMQVSPEDKGPKVVAKDTNFKNFVLEADVSITGARDGQSVFNAGFVFHVSEPGTGADAYNGYYVGISLDGAIAGKATASGDSGTWQELGTGSLDTALDFGDVVKIKLVAQNGEYSFYVDDMNTSVLDFEDDGDTTFDTGSIGFRIWQCGATFDNVKVSVEE